MHNPFDTFMSVAHAPCVLICVHLEFYKFSLKYKFSFNIFNYSMVRELTEMGQRLDIRIKIRKISLSMSISNT